MKNYIIAWFKNKYLEIYHKRKTTLQFVSHVPLKKELFCYIVYYILKLKEKLGDES